MTWGTRGRAGERAHSPAGTERTPRAQRSMAAETPAPTKGHAKAGPVIVPTTRSCAGAPLANRSRGGRLEVGCASRLRSRSCAHCTGDV